MNSVTCSLFPCSGQHWHDRHVLPFGFAAFSLQALFLASAPASFAWFRGLILDFLFVDDLLFTRTRLRAGFVAVKPVIAALCVPCRLSVSPGFLAGAEPG